MHDEDLRYYFNRMEERLSGIERRQMLANSRIRQEVISTGIASASAGLIALFIWTGVKWQWWYIFLPTLGVPWLSRYFMEEARKREEPKDVLYEDR